jgi:hypothetical protein
VIRIATRLTPAGVIGVVFDEAEVVATISGAGEPLGMLRDLLGELTAGRSGLVASVTIDLDALLQAALLPDAAAASDTARNASGSVVLLRIAARPPSHEALRRHPDPLVARHTAATRAVLGGHDVTGIELAELDAAAVLAIADELATGVLADAGLRDVAIVASGAPASPMHERQVAEMLLDRVPGLRVSTSHDFGGLGLSGRVSSTVVNAVLALPAEEMINACEDAVHRVLADVPLGFARGDGGRSPAPTLRAHPVLGLCATSAMTVSGLAAHTAQRDCRVVMADGERLLLAEVRDALPVVLPEQPVFEGTRLSVPTARFVYAATPGPDALPEWMGQGSDGPIVIAADVASKPEPQNQSNLTVAEADLDVALLATALCAPMAWVDEVARVADPGQIQAARADAEQRALVMAVAAGGRPTTERLVESAVMALPYGGGTTVRIRVRAVSELSLNSSLWAKRRLDQ